VHCQSSLGFSAVARSDPQAGHRNPSGHRDV